MTLNAADISPTPTATDVAPVTSTSDTAQPATLVTEPATQVATDTTAPADTSTMASEVASLVGLTTTDPTAPAQPAPVPVDSPMDWTLAAAARRDLGTALTSTDPATVDTSQTLATPTTFATLAAADPVNSPPQSAGVTQSAPNTETGAITGSLNVTDPNGDPITYTVASAPTSGSLTLNSDGTFTYTPTQRARLAAGATLPADFDGFTVNASDGQATTAVPVSVEIYSGQMMPEGLDQFGSPTSAGTITTGFGPTALVTRDNTLYVANTAESSVSAIDLTTGQTIKTVPVGAAPMALAVSPDGQRVYTANSSGNSVSVVDLASGTTIANIPAGGPYGLALNPTGTRLYVSSTYFNNISVIDTATGATVATIPVGVTPVGVTTNSNGTRLYVANRGSGTVSTIDTATNQVIGTTAVGSLPQQVALTADGNRLYVTNTGSNSVSVIDANTGANLATVPVGSGPNAITFSPDGSLAYVANGDNSLSVIDTKTLTKVTGTVPVQEGAFGGVAVGPDGTAYVANSAGNTVRMVSLVHVDPPPLTANPNAGPLVEDFSGPAGAQPDPSVFNREAGYGGAGVVSINTLDPANGGLDGNGNLVITARNQPVQDPYGNPFNYTTAAYDTKDKFEFTYGTLSMQVKVPAGQGLHTTIAMFGSDIDQVGWPNAGEVDILELYNSAASSGSALHGPGGYNVSGAAPVDVTDGQYHTVTTQWEPNKITTSIDGQVVRTFTPDDLPPGTPWTFNDRSMYLVFSLEVGGAVQPDATTPFPSSIVVDSLTYTPLDATAATTGTTTGTTTAV